MITIKFKKQHMFDLYIFFFSPAKSVSDRQQII